MMLEVNGTITDLKMPEMIPQQTSDTKQSMMSSSRHRSAAHR